MKNIINIICVLFFLWQLFFGEGWATVFCRLLVGGCVVYWLVSKYILNKQEQEQEKHSLDGVWYYLDMGIFKLEWIDMEAGDDPYVSKMHNALQKLLDSLV